MTPTTAGPIGLHCPGCGNLAAFSIGGQVFCGTGGCRILSWDPAQTLAEALEQFGTVDLSPRESGESS